MFKGGALNRESHVQFSFLRDGGSPQGLRVGDRLSFPFLSLSSFGAAGLGIAR